MTRRSPRGPTDGVHIKDGRIADASPTARPRHDASPCSPIATCCGARRARCCWCSGIALAVATALALLALSRSIERSTADSARERGADLTVSQRDASDIFSGFVDAKLEPAIAAVPGVKGVAGELVMFAPVDGEYQFLAVGMADDSYFWPAMPIAEGRLAGEGRAPRRADRRERRQGARQAHRRRAHDLRPDGEDHRHHRLQGGGQPRRHRAAGCRTCRSCRFAPTR